MNETASSLPRSYALLGMIVILPRIVGWQAECRDEISTWPTDRASKAMGNYASPQYKHNKSGPSKSRGPGGQHKPSDLARRNAAIGREANRANAILFGRKKPGRGRPAGPQTRPQELHWTQPRDLHVPDWMMFDRNVANLSIGSGSVPVRGPWIIRIPLSILSAGMILSVVAPASADGGGEHSWLSAASEPDGEAIERYPDAGRQLDGAGDGPMPSTGENATQNVARGGRFPRSHGTKRKTYKVGKKSELTRTLELMIPRRVLFAALLQAEGIDPYALSDAVYRPPNAEQFKETKPNVDQFIDAQVPDFFTRITFSPEIEEVRGRVDGDEIFWSMIESIKLRRAGLISQKIKDIISEKLGDLALYGTADHTVDRIAVSEPDSLWRWLWPSITTSPVGYVIQFENHDIHRNISLIVAPGHPDLIVPVSSNRSEQIEWVDRHRYLFFADNLKLDEKKFGSDYIISIEEGTRHLFTVNAVDAVGKQFAVNTVNAFKDEAYGETRREKMLNHLQWHFPFYSAWLAFRRREYSEAFVRAALDVIAIAGGPFASALKKIGIVSKNGVLVKIGESLQGVGKLNLPGVVDEVKVAPLGAIGKKMGGGPGTFVGNAIGGEINQSPQHNTLNQLVDYANSGRARDREQINGIVRNT